jgi:hypothetical protein
MVNRHGGVGLWKCANVTVPAASREMVGIDGGGLGSAPGLDKGGDGLKH